MVQVCDRQMSITHVDGLVSIDARSGGIMQVITTCFNLERQPGVQQSCFRHWCSLMDALPPDQLPRRLSLLMRPVLHRLALDERGGLHKVRRWLGLFNPPPPSCQAEHQRIY